MFHQSETFSQKMGYESQHLTSKVVKLFALSSLITLQPEPVTWSDLHHRL